MCKNVYHEYFQMYNDLAILRIPQQNFVYDLRVTIQSQKLLFTSAV